MIWVSALVGAALQATPVAANDSDAIQQLNVRIAQLEQRAQRQEDREAIEKLTRAYGYYVDKQLWDQIVDLFSSDARIEIAGRGVYRGKSGADEIFRQVMGGGQIGLRDGALFNHMILQGIVDVSEDGNSANGRWRAFVQLGQHERVALWSEGTYENRYVKIGGVWQIADMHFYATYYTPYDQGWRDGALPNNGPNAAFPPDEPQSVQYDVFPGHYVPPFHYDNPVSGRPWSESDSRRYSTQGQSPPPARPATDPEQGISQP